MPSCAQGSLPMVLGGAFSVKIKTKLATGKESVLPDVLSLQLSVT